MNKTHNILMENEQYRKVLRIVLTLHLIMFALSLLAAMIARSTSVFADSLDFIGDASSYLVSFLLIGRKIVWQSIVAIFKGITMMVFCIPVLMYATTNYLAGSTPNYEVMTIAGIAGIITHLFCIWLLWPYRSGDSNRLSVWICTINDLLCNILTVCASVAVMYTQQAWPDLLAAILIVLIAFIGAFAILRQAIYELKLYSRC